MKEELIMKVKPETLDSLINALVDITSEMKSAAPDPQVRFGDEVYMTCLCLENTVLGAIRQVELKKKRANRLPDNWQPGKTGRGGRHGRRVGKSKMRKRRKPSGFDSPLPTILTSKI